MYQLKDDTTVKQILIPDFFDPAGGLLELIVKNTNASYRNDLIDKVQQLYNNAQNRYDEKEEIYSRFELDSEYYPIVIIRSLLPQVGHFLKTKDYSNAHLVATWIGENIKALGRMVANLAAKRGMKPRDFVSYD